LIISDHQGFIVDLDLEEYFNTTPSYYDKVDYSKLDSSRKSYRIKFYNMLEAEIIKRNIDERINNITNKTIKEELEWIDNDLTFVMNAARKVVEEVQWKVLFLMAKLKGQVVIGFWNAQIKWLKSRVIDLEVLEKRRKIIEGPSNRDIDLN